MDRVNSNESVALSLRLIGQIRSNGSRTGPPCWETWPTIPEEKLVEEFHRRLQLEVDSGGSREREKEGRR